VANWDGGGFVVESSTMDPVRVTNRNLEGGYSEDGFYIYNQRAQAVVVSPSTVSVDLDRESFLPGSDSSQNQNGTGESSHRRKSENPSGWA
jgi:hypothetical protein